ncbi:NUDIX domain-containing protein [Alicyclobacillus ferrooxydans]|nr:NUDIX domain-containing protein [Alicyclobacillus ferrooxydans]
MNDKMSFGEPIVGVNYIPRESAYAVIFRNPDEIEVATVSRQKGHHMLPRGGIEPGEDHVTCLKREVLEEAGYGIRIGAYIVGQADQYYVTLEGESRLTVGHFYLAEILGKADDAIEELEFSWLSAGKANESLFLNNQAWAVSAALRG